MRLIARYFLLVVVLCSVPVAIAFPGCSGQGEGERCDIRADSNGDDDCAGDLKCFAAGSLNGSNTDRCCPADRTQATTEVCKLPTASGIDAAPPPVDAAGSDAPTDGPVGTDGSADAPADSEADSGADAPADAPADAG
jgi:hypothetical protein